VHEFDFPSTPRRESVAATPATTEGQPHVCRSRASSASRADHRRSDEIGVTVLKLPSVETVHASTASRSESRCTIAASIAGADDRAARQQMTIGGTLRAVAADRQRRAVGRLRVTARPRPRTSPPAAKTSSRSARVLPASGHRLPTAADPPINTGRARSGETFDAGNRRRAARRSGRRECCVPRGAIPAAVRANAVYRIGRFWTGPAAGRFLGAAFPRGAAGSRPRMHAATIRRADPAGSKDGRRVRRAGG